MSIIKSFDVGNGDMYYIRHGSPNFTVIDCCINDENEDVILSEIGMLREPQDISRFISTHPDDDHMRGLDTFDDRIGIDNFYCVKNSTSKQDQTTCFTRYCQLRDSKKAYYLQKGCRRHWLNDSNETRNGSGIEVLWPDPTNEHYKEALQAAAQGGSPNNISPIITYTLKGGARAMWMGDLETEFMEKIQNEVDLPLVDILFAPHHGRASGRVPGGMLAKINPQLIVIGEAPSAHLHYYSGYNTITQNSGGSFAFDCRTGAVHVYSSEVYFADFLEDRSWQWPDYHYVGSFSTYAA